jgi:ADP-ribose pyrophosphatase
VNSTQLGEVFSGKIFKVTRDKVSIPGKGEFIREIVRHSGAVVIVPLISETEVLLVKQYRFAAEAQLWEVPAGTLEPGESPRECAARELEEETGYRAGQIQPLLEFYSTPGFCDEFMRLFTARELTPGRQELDADEALVAERVHLERAKEMVATGEIRDAKTIIGLAAVSGWLNIDLPSK